MAAGHVGSSHVLCSLCLYVQLENEGIIQQQIASRIYDYISTQWVKPYPVVDDIWAMNLDLPVIPLTGDCLLHHN